jgi:hypothetical protein
MKLVRAHCPYTHVSGASTLSLYVVCLEKSVILSSSLHDVEVSTALFLPQITCKSS